MPARAQERVKYYKIIQKYKWSGHQCTEEWNEPPSAFPIRSQYVSVITHFSWIKAATRNEMAPRLALPPNACQLFFRDCFLNLSFAKQKEGRKKESHNRIIFFFFLRQIENLSSSHASSQPCIHHHNVAWCVTWEFGTHLRKGILLIFVPLASPKPSAKLHNPSNSVGEITVRTKIHGRGKEKKNLSSLFWIRCYKLRSRVL